MQYMEIAAPLVSAFIIAGSVFYASRAYRQSQKKMAYDVYDKFADRMFTIRALQITNGKIPEIWSGGPEGIALQNVLPEHFYFAKMLFQTNEAIFLALSDKAIKTQHTKMDLDGWRSNFETDLSAPTFSNIWTEFVHVRNSYSKEFQAEVEKILKGIKATSAG